MFVELFRNNDSGNKSLLNLDGCKDISCWESDQKYNITFVFDAPYSGYQIDNIERNSETNEVRVTKETKHHLEYTQTFESKEERDTCYENICKNLTVVRAKNPNPQVLNE